MLDSWLVSSAICGLVVARSPYNFAAFNPTTSPRCPGRRFEDLIYASMGSMRVVYAKKEKGEKIESILGVVTAHGEPCSAILSSNP